MTAPFILHKGLAIYQRRPKNGPAKASVLLLPYPHAHCHRPMIDEALTDLLLALQCRVISFDPPAMFSSTRKTDMSLEEMVRCTLESLSLLEIERPVTVMGHSMAALCALAFCLRYPEQVKRLILIGAPSGYRCIRRFGMPKNWHFWQLEKWQCMYWGALALFNKQNLAQYKKLGNLVERVSLVNPSLAEPWLIEPGDQQRPPPKRSQWIQTVPTIELLPQLHQIQQPVFLAYGQQDPQTPVPVGEEIQSVLPNAQLTLFPHSGHAPFADEPEAFKQWLAEVI